MAYMIFNFFKTIKLNLINFKTKSYIKLNIKLLLDLLYVR